MIAEAISADRAMAVTLRVLIEASNYATAEFGFTLDFRGLELKN
jgi:hypothetical protein